MALGLLSACGLRTDPVPQSFLIPPTAEVNARFREDRILLSWQKPPLEETRKRGAVLSYSVSVRRLPLGCMDCRPITRQDVWLGANSPELIVENEMVYFQWVPSGEPTQWLIQVRTRFEAGESALSKPVVVEGVANVPAHALASEAAPRGRQMRLYWTSRQERTVLVLTTGGGQVERPVYYRVNVYRRYPPAPWPLSPLNSSPLETLQFPVTPPAASARGGPGQVEYAIRLVDSFGNEGALSEPVSFALATGERG
jgi:hypothetical protein